MLLPLFGITQKKKSCISQRVIPLLVQRTGGKENFSLSGFFTCFGRVDDRKVRALTVIIPLFGITQKKNHVFLRE